ncbi:MAG: hypothetical protein JEY94_03615 [Melioribacteraceae bacterium]|nr:hypothetical protein [Melioribacteraceae bacterium]
MKNKIKYPIILYIALLFLISSVKGICQNNVSEINVLTLENRLMFGNYLYKEHDYLRAINEFHDYLRFENNDTIRFKAADCFHKMGRLDEAADNYKGLFFNSTLMSEARLAYIKSKFDERQFASFRNLVVQKTNFAEKYTHEIFRLKNITYLLDNTFLPERNEFIESFPQNYRTDIENFYNRKLHPEYKSPVYASILSAIIPGAGKIYTGNIGDGITSLLFTGVLSYLSYTNFDNDHKTRAWVFTGLAGYFYAGNIYGSAASAHIYNADVNFTYKSDLEQFLNSVNYFLPEFGFLK